MKKLLLAIFILFPCCWSSKLFAQQTNISGSVADVDTKAAIVGASIIVKGKLTGTTSGADGSFSLSTTVPSVCRPLKLDTKDYYVSIVFDQLLN